LTSTPCPALIPRRFDHLRLDASHIWRLLTASHALGSQIATFTRPTDETIDAVTRWLGKNGLNATRSELPEYIHFTVPIGQANSLLDAKLVYRLCDAER